jgi:site-specific DNA-methyltransferase (adenine-specific)
MGEAGQILSATVINADSIDHLKTLPDSSIDAVVTDPPYGLGNCSPRAVSAALTAWLAGEEYQPSGAGFMGKSWDAFVPGPELWREVYRVLKPGGHAVIFAGSRTVDLMGIAVRLAGFEVRDMLHWLYGSGFPKSHDVSKALDKRAGAEREVIGIGVSGHNAIGEDGGMGAFDITAPTSPLAQQWSGWGTALKPAHEPILLCRKPLSGSVAENVEQWGVGGLNIDGCRIETDEYIFTTPRTQQSHIYGKYAQQDPMQSTGQEIGRWPANILLDPSAGAALDLQAGFEASRFFYEGKASREEREAGLVGLEARAVGDGRGTPIDNPYQRGETKRQNVHPTVKPIAVMRWLCKLITPPGGVILDPFCGSGTTGCAATQLGFEFVGIEREPEYAEIARARIAHWGCLPPEELGARKPAKQPTLF